MKLDGGKPNMHKTSFTKPGLGNPKHVVNTCCALYACKHVQRTTHAAVYDDGVIHGHNENSSRALVYTLLRSVVFATKPLMSPTRV